MFHTPVMGPTDHPGPQTTDQPALGHAVGEGLQQQGQAGGGEEPWLLRTCGWCRR